MLAGSKRKQSEGSNWLDIEYQSETKIQIGFKVRFGAHVQMVYPRK